MHPRSLATAATLVLAGTGGVAVAAGFAADTGGTPARAARAGAPATAAGAVTEVPGDGVVGLAQVPSGPLLAVSLNDTSAKRQFATLSAIPLVGGRATRFPIVRRPTGDARVTSMVADVSAAGAVAAWSRGRRGTARRTLVVTTVAPDGHRIAQGAVPGLARGAAPFTVAIGPTGAVGLIAIATSRDGPVATFSFRPAGAASFGAPVELGQASIPSEDGSLNSDLPGSVVQLAMAPGGGAAIVDGPTGSLRRVAPDGAVGEEQRLGEPFANETLATFRDDGTLVAAGTRLIENTSRKPGEAGYTTRILLAEWPPAAATPSIRTLPPQPESNGIALSVGPQGRTALSYADHGKLVVLAGTGLAVEPFARLRAKGGMYDIHAFLGADGGTTMLWSPDGTDAALLTATAPPGGAFTRPHSILKAVNSGAQVGAAIALPDGRLAIGYHEGDGRQAVLVTKP